MSGFDGSGFLAAITGTASGRARLRELDATYIPPEPEWGPYRLDSDGFYRLTVRGSMSYLQWHRATRRLWKKHNRAAALMVRPWRKRRTAKKWAAEYARTLARIPIPPEPLEWPHNLGP